MNTTLVNLQKLRNDQLKAFDKFLQSPYFNTNQTQVKLLTYLRKYHPNFPPKKTSKEALTKYLFGADTIGESKVNSQLTKLQDNLREFLKIEAFEEDKLGQEFYLLEGLKKLGDQNKVKDQIQKIRNSLNNKNSKQAKDYLRLYELQYYELKQEEKQENPWKQEDLQDLGRQLDTYYFIERMRVYNAMENLEKELGSAAKLDFFEEFEQHLKISNVISCSQELKALHLLSEFLREQNIKNFEKLQSFITKKVDEIPKYTILQIVTLLINYANLLYRKESEAGHKLKFSLVKWAYERGVYTDNAKMDPLPFLNISNIASLAGEIEFNKEFRKKALSLLSEDANEFYPQYTQAFQDFVQKNFHEARINLLQLKPNNSVKKRCYYSLISRCSFEVWLLDKNYEASFDSDLNGFDNFFSNSKDLSESVKQGFLNFHNVLRRICRLRNSKYFRINMHDRIENYLQLESNVKYKAWLFDKLATVRKEREVKD